MLTLHWKMACTGRWSENLRGAELYESWRKLEPFLNMRSVQAGIRAFSLQRGSVDDRTTFSFQTYDVSYSSVPRSNL